MPKGDACFWTTYLDKFKQTLPRTRIFLLSTKLTTCSQVVWALWRGKVCARVVLQVLAIQAYRIKLAFAMCLLQCLYCPDEAHMGRNRGSLSAVLSEF